MKKMKKVLYGLLTLIIVTGATMFNSTRTQAAKNYVINISKTSPKAAEKKLAKVKASSKQRIYLRVKAKSKKQARTNVKNWLKKFQKVEANTYGVLPMMYHPSLSNFEKDKKNKGYYTYGLYDTFGPSGDYYDDYNDYYDYASNYVNMRTICKKSYKAMNVKYYYVGDYFDNIEYKISGVVSEEINKSGDKVVTRVNLGSWAFETKGQTYTTKELKKQSDSVRIQYFLYGIGKEELVGIDFNHPKYESYEINLYKVAKKRFLGDRMELPRLYRIIARHLSVYIQTSEIITSKYDYYGLIKARNSKGNWDYFDVIYNSISSFSQGVVYDSIKNKDKKLTIKPELKKELYNWAGKNKQTEYDITYLKKCFEEIKSGLCIERFLAANDIWDARGDFEEFSCLESGPIDFYAVNKNKTKYGFESSFHAVQLIYDEKKEGYYWDWN